MTADFRALCAELVRIADALDGGARLISNQGQALDGYSALAAFRAVADRARAALAEEPVPEGPTDEELLELAEDWPCTTGERHDLSGCPEVPLFSVFEDELVEFARAVLARWGHQPAPPAEGEQRHPTPVPVAERLPGPEDCDAGGRCWFFIDGAQWAIDGAHWALEDRTYGCNRHRSHWLPAHALPLPAGKVEPNAE